MSLDGIAADIGGADDPLELLDTAALLWSILEAGDLLDLTPRLERYLLGLSEELEAAAAYAQQRERPAAAVAADL